MRKYAKAGAVLALALFGAGCDSFIQGPGLTENPNNPISGTPQQQLIAVQANMATILEGQLARTAGIYTQQIIGSNNQQLLVTGYGYGESDYNTFFSNIYAGGGLLAMRNVQAGGVAQNDKVLEGIGKVWEGLAIGTATSIWGDIPYSEAVSTVLTPKLDAQQEVYAGVQKVLDEGIAALQAASTAGNCDVADLVYCSTSGPRTAQVSKWIAAANTMKARFYLDLVERQGNAAYSLALAAAEKGILTAPANAEDAMHGRGAGDFRLFHGNTQNVDANSWAGFLTERGGDIVAGHTLVQLLKDRSDPRLSAYFTANSAGGFVGRDENNKDVGTGGPSQINTAVRRVFSFRQPIVTWAENQMILAEAKFKLTGPDAALPHVNAVRQSVGLPALTSVTFQDVMLEKYIVMFQNIAAWSDFKRTCLPLIRPFGSAAEVPGRVPYGSAERTTNPNIPLPSAYPAGTTGVSGLRNWNDPAACPRP